MSECKSGLRGAAGRRHPVERYGLTSYGGASVFCPS
jgi:hypothetical protein